MYNTYENVQEDSEILLILEVINVDLSKLVQQRPNIWFSIQISKYED